MLRCVYPRIYNLCRINSKIVKKTHNFAGILRRECTTSDPRLLSEAPCSRPLRATNDLLFCGLRRRFVHLGLRGFDRGQRTDGLETAARVGI